MPLFRYDCPAGHAHDLLRGREVAVLPCPDCGSPATRQAVNHIGFTGFAQTPRDQKNYRQSFSEYKEASAEVNYACDREGVTPPDLYGAAKARVNSA